MVDVQSAVLGWLGEKLLEVGVFTRLDARYLVCGDFEFTVLVDGLSVSLLCYRYLYGESGVFDYDSVLEVRLLLGDPGFDAGLVEFVGRFVEVSLGG